MPARIPSPSALGLPPKYERWREQQIHAIEFVQQSTKRIRALAASPGVGKTGVAWALAIMQRQCKRRQTPNARTLILTETKALQGIYADESKEMAAGLVANISGANNYVCNALLDGGRYEHLNRNGQSTMVDHAPCLAGMPCKLRDHGCTYYGNDGALQKARDAAIVITNYANWIAAAELADREEKFGEFDLVILDECFPAGTDVSGLPIEQIKIGDVLESFDENGVVWTNRVVGVMRKKPQSLVRVRLHDGRVVVCTPNHPFRTSRGWRAAEELSSDDDVLGIIDYAEVDNGDMLLVQAGVRVFRLSTEMAFSPHRSSLLLQRVWKGVSQPVSNGPPDDCRESTHAFSSHEHIEPYEIDECSTKNEDYFEENWTQASSPRRQRKGNDDSSIETASQPREWVVCRVVNQPWTVESWVSDALQSGHRIDDLHDCGGSRRRIAPVAFEEEAGRKKGSCVAWIGVDSVEVLQQTSDGTFGGVCPDGYVYNLEVENDHTYFANGIGVHNCHAAMDALCRALAVEIDLRDVKHVMEPLRNADGVTALDWIAWAKRVQPRVQFELDEHLAEIKTVRGTGARVPARMVEDLRRLQRLARSLERAAGARGEWVVERTATRVKFKPVWGDAYTESHVLRAIPNVVFMSGTLVKQDLEYMGVDTSARHCDWFEMPSPFPVARRPVFIFPCARMRWDMTSHEEAEVFMGMDAVIKSREGWRFLVHTVSYDRALKVERQSKYAAERMIVDHRGDSTAEIIEAFKRNPQRDLGVVSPAISTGHDFPDDQARFQIILKIPIADARDAVTKARVAHSKKYLYYAAMKYITQAIFRIVRSESDYGETWILDTSWTIWFERAAKEFMAAWLKPAVKVVSGIGRRPKL